MKLKIETAAISDLQEVQNLNLLLFKKEYAEFDTTLNCDWTFSENGTQYFASRINEGSVFVARIDTKIVGYLACGIREYHVPYRKQTVTAELESMFVLDNYRGKGIGTALYDAFLTWCKAHGVGRIRVVASAQNVTSTDFYRKKGLSDYDLALEADI